MLTDKDSIKVDEKQQGEDLKEQFERTGEGGGCEVEISEFKKFEKWKNEENKKTRHSNKCSASNKQETHANVRSQEEYELIEELKTKLSQTKEEMEQKETINKMNIEQLKKQISEANREIAQLMKTTNNSNSNSNCISSHNHNHKTLPVQVTSERNINIVNSVAKHSNNTKHKNHKHKILFKQNFTKRTNSNNNNNDSNNSTLFCE